jgi:hypothetical protein
MTTLLKIQPAQGQKANHNESGLLIQPKLDRGLTNNHNESGLKTAK